MTPPRWTLIVPTHNRPAALRATLAAIHALEPPAGGHEVVVVDDGGDADPAAAVEESGVRLLRQHRAGPAAARNAGAAAARGDRLAFVDDDCCPRPDWLVRLDEMLDRFPEAMVGGRTVNALRANRFSEASQQVVDYLYAVENADPMRMRFFTSNNMALGRVGFERIGGFDTGYPQAAGEDRALCDAWRAADRRLVFVAGAVMMHHHHLRPGSFWRQHVGYGRGAYQLRRRRADARGRPRRGPGRVRLERLGFYARLLAFPWKGRPAGEAMGLSALLGVAQVAAAVGFVDQARRARRERGAGGRVGVSEGRTHAAAAAEGGEADVE